MKLIIVESPSKCKKIEQYLGKQFKCIATLGHLCNVDTKQGLKCIHHDFTLNYKISKQKQLNVLKQWLKKCSHVYIGTDDDREGEAIGWMICKLLNLSIQDTPRIIFHEISKQALTYAIQHPTHIRMNIVWSQQARQCLDIIIGFTLSPLLWSYTKGCTSIGRCQTPAVRFIYEQHQLIQNNPPEEQLTTEGKFYSTKIPLKKIFYSHDEVCEFLNKSIQYQHTYTSTPYSIYKEFTYKPLTTSTLQQYASLRLRMSPKQTMKYAQTLYENGWITYMRTDALCYSLNFIHCVKDYINEHYSEDYFKLNCYNQYKKKSKDPNAHESIRPINIDKPFRSNDKNLEKLYYLIWNISIQSCMTEAEYLTYTLTIYAPMNTYYEKRMKQLVFEGFLIMEDIYADVNYEFYKWCPQEPTKKDEQKFFGGLTIPKPDTIKPYNQIIKYDKIITTTTLNQKYKHFTEASLIKTLEKHNIGRPSTYSTILSTIQQRNYIKQGTIDGIQVHVYTYTLDCDDVIHTNIRQKTLGKETRKLYITPLGIELIQFVLNHFEEFFNYSYTSYMETQLDKIEQNKDTRINVCKTTQTYLNNMVKDEKTKLKKVDKRIQHQWNINDDMKLCRGKYGVYLKYKDMNINLISWFKDTLLPGFDETTRKKIKMIWEQDDLNKLQDYIGEKSFYSMINTNCKSYRKINEYTSVRKSKYGLYIYYKTPSMKQPKFISLKQFKQDPLTCNINDLHSYIEMKLSFT